MPKRKRPIAADDLCRIEVVGEPRISPDGSRVAYVVTSIDRDANAYRSAIWIVSADRNDTRGAVAPSRPFTRGARREGRPRWSPDGRLLAFLSDRDSPKTQLFVMPADGGEACQLTSRAEGVTDFAWSPASDQLVFVSRVRPDESPTQDGAEPPVVRAVDRIKHKADGQGLFEGRSHLFVISAAGGDSVQITDGEWDDAEPTWSPDGRTIAFASNRTAGRDWNDASDIWAVPAGGGRARRLSRAIGTLTAPAWSPDGRQIACLGHAADAPAGANVRVWLVPSQGGTPRCLTQHHDISVGSDILSDLRQHAPSPVPVWSPDGARLLVPVSERGNAHVLAIQAGTGEVRPIIGGERQVVSFSLSADGRRIAFDATSPLDPGQVFVADADGSDERPLTNRNRALLETIEVRAPEPFEFDGAGGVPVQGWFLQGRGRGRRPTILEIHGGPHALYGNGFFFEFQLLAAHGYNVLYTNPRGSRGYGERFCSEIAGAWGELDYQDLMAAVDGVVTRPDVDGERLGVAGGSYGGFMTNWIIGHGDRFKAAVSMRGLSNFISMYGTSDIGAWFCERELLGNPREQLERYLRMSPITYADRIATPLLILHGEQDLRCPLEQAEQLFVALRRAGKPVELLRFPEESHDMSRSGRPDRRLLRLERIVDWFDHWLGSRGSNAARPGRRARRATRV